MATTTSLLADLVENVGGGRVAVYSVIPAGADVHSFQTTPQDGIEIGRAGLIVSNGLGLDDFLKPMIESAARADAVRAVASEGLKAGLVKDAELSQQESEKLSKPLSRMQDPHFWQNPMYTIHYIELIRDGLAKADPANEETYRDNADEYIRELRELDREISRVLEEVPPRRRHLVTFHDAFGHFAARYGWQVTGLVANDAAGVTPRTIISMMEQVREEGIPAVFAEPQFRFEVIDRAAEDMGVRVGTIYSDVLDDSVSTYIDMMQFNARSLAEHLSQQ